MMTSRRFVVSSAGLLWFASVVTSGQHPAITVGPNVQVSRAHGDLSHNEVLLAADPVNPGTLLGCSIVFDPIGDKTITLAYITFDGGRSWAPADTADRTGLTGDPACAIGPNGQALFTAIEHRDPDIHRLALTRSTNGGKTWLPTQALFGSSQIDRDYVSVDRSTGPYRGRVYVHGQIPHRGVTGERLPIAFALWHSTDDGATFRGPVLRPTAAGLVFHPGNCIALSDSTLVCLVAELDSSKRNDGYVGSTYRNATIPNGTIKVVVSTDGGESLQPAVKVNDLYGDWRDGMSTIPMLASDPGSAAFKDRLYAVWADGRHGRTQILLSVSADKGKTWSNPRIINDDVPFSDREGPHHSLPVVAVNTQGVVGVSWYDRRESADNLSYFVRFRASLDGGDSWLPSVRVSEKPKDFTQSKWMVRAQAFAGPPTEGITVTLRRWEWLAGGHTAGLAADAAGAFHPFWVDDRTGVSQVWTAAVNVNGLGLRHGGTDLAYLADVSSQVRLELARPVYDREKDQITVEAAVKNVSKQALGAPLKVRVVNLGSDTATATIVNADNKEASVGAVWDFTGAIGEVLPPGAVSKSRTLFFRLSDHRPYRQGSMYRFGLANLDVRVYARLSAPETR
jgi:hypothetical protein